MVVCVIGLGQIGFPVAKYIVAKGYDVYGFDINPVAVEYGIQNGKFKATTQWGQIPKADVYIICVTTAQVNNQADLSAVFETVRKIAEKADANTLVSIESTILPGTSKKIFEEFFKKDILLVHAPHRYWADQEDKYGVNQVRVIGGVNAESLNAGIKFYKDSLGIPMHTVSTVEIAEMCKIIENSHRYLQIAFAEDLKMMCNHINMDFDELREAMNTKWNVDLPEARDGIGRHCLPKDIRYVTSLAPSILLNSAMEVDQKYREWLTKQKV
ncbi:MAG: NAD(P)-binding domain-containing protein [Candidatus Bathyarchaeota archaeon]|nr:NAD(P)-binding domain-containing protein [Candidatus Termiticorpusculum sp.]MCL1970347.1 NAD(P)-binding domain-containing protein [Candidatus Termiticorpusculum sp.]